MSEPEVYTFDIESNGLTREVTAIHCIVIQDHSTGCVYRYHDYINLPGEGTLQDGIDSLEEADVLIGHNIAGFDIDALRRIAGAKLDKPYFIDTMLLCSILHPNLQANSLENLFSIWGIEEVKIKNDDWSVLTENILNRCVSDVKGNTAVYDILYKEAEAIQKKAPNVIDFKKAMKTEVDNALIHCKQVLHGVGYNIKQAREYVKAWDAEMAELSDKIVSKAPRFALNPYTVEVKKPLLKQSKKDIKAGKDPEYSSAVWSWFDSDDNWEYDPDYDDEVMIHDITTVQGPFSRLAFKPINMNSGDQVKKYLLSLGWEPTEWNFKKKGKTFVKDERGNRIRTSPKLTEDSYDSIPPGLGQDVARYNILKHRRGLLLNISGKGGSLYEAEKNVYPENPDFGNVVSDAFTCGTNTARYRHTAPVANIPDAKTILGFESRSVYCPPPGQIQVGVDLSGIEARRLCDLCFDYPGGREFAELVLDGDWHSVNAGNWSVSRRVAKIILYAMMYGATDFKLGMEAGAQKNKAEARGAEIRGVFLETNPAYDMLVKDLEKAYEANGKWIPSIDGRPFYPRNKKDVLNTAIQGDCAIIFKKWIKACQTIEDVVKRYAHQMIAYHDETQWAYNKFTAKYHPESFGRKVVNMAGVVGKELNIKVPIDAAFDCGTNWAMCH